MYKNKYLKYKLNINEIKEEDKEIKNDYDKLKKEYQKLVNKMTEEDKKSNSNIEKIEIELENKNKQIKNKIEKIKEISNNKIEIKMNMIDKLNADKELEPLPETDAKKKSKKLKEDEELVPMPETDAKKKSKKLKEDEELEPMPETEINEKYHIKDIRLVCDINDQGWGKESSIIKLKINDKHEKIFSVPRTRENSYSYSTVDKPNNNFKENHIFKWDIDMEIDKKSDLSVILSGSWPGNRVGIKNAKIYINIIKKIEKKIITKKEETIIKKIENKQLFRTGRKNNGENMAKNHESYWNININELLN